MVSLWREKKSHWAHCFLWCKSHMFVQSFFLWCKSYIIPQRKEFSSYGRWKKKFIKYIALHQPIHHHSCFSTCFFIMGGIEKVVSSNRNSNELLWFAILTCSSDCFLDFVREPMGVCRFVANCDGTHFHA